MKNIYLLGQVFWTVTYLILNFSRRSYFIFSKYTMFQIFIMNSVVIVVGKGMLLFGDVFILRVAVIE